MKFVFASHNKGKIQEVQEILAPFGIEIEPIPADFPEIEENGTSFEENAKDVYKRQAMCPRAPVMLRLPMDLPAM